MDEVSIVILEMIAGIISVEFCLNADGRKRTRLPDAPEGFLPKINHYPGGKFYSVEKEICSILEVYPDRQLLRRENGQVDL